MAEGHPIRRALIALSAPLVLSLATQPSRIQLSTTSPQDNDQLHDVENLLHADPLSAHIQKTLSNPLPAPLIARSEEVKDLPLEQLVSYSCRIDPEALFILQHPQQAQQGIMRADDLGDLIKNATVLDGYVDEEGRKLSGIVQEISEGLDSEGRNVKAVIVLGFVPAGAVTYCDFAENVTDDKKIVSET